MALLTLEDDGSLETYADLSALSPFGFNDIVVDGHGNAYINSGNFAFTDGSGRPGGLRPRTPWPLRAMELRSPARR